MDFVSLFKPITYNNPYVNPIVTNYNMSFLSPCGPIYNFGTNLNHGNIFSFGWQSFNSGGFYGGNPFGSNQIGFPIFTFTSSDKQTQSISSKTTPKAKVETTKVTSPIKQKNTTANESLELKQAFSTNANKYLGYKESDGSSRKFSDSKEWCADFVTYVVKESYREKGLKAPDWFGNHRTEILRKQAKENDSYLCLTDKTDKAKTIQEKVNIGDIMILRENGASHTGFVSKIYNDGSFDTIEGNRGDAVAKGHYKANDPELSGFVQLTV